MFISLEYAKTSELIQLTFLIISKDGGRIKYSIPPSLLQHFPHSTTEGEHLPAIELLSTRLAEDEGEFENGMYGLYIRILT